MQLISFYKEYDYCRERAFYLFDEFTFALQLRYGPMTKIEPPDILIIYDIKDIYNIKKVGRVPLGTYQIGIFTKEKMFISSWEDERKIMIYKYQNFLNIIENDLSYEPIEEICENEKCKPYVILLKKYYYFFNKYIYRFNVLNNNDLVIYGKGQIDLYTIN